MSLKKVGWLENSVAKADGIYSADGKEMLKSTSMTDAQIAEWNGSAAPAPKKTVEVADTVTTNDDGLVPIEGEVDTPLEEVTAALRKLNMFKK